MQFSNPFIDNFAIVANLHYACLTMGKFKGALHVDDYHLVVFEVLRICAPRLEHKIVDGVKTTAKVSVFPMKKHEAHTSA